MCWRPLVEAKRRLPLYTRIFIGLVLGTVVGLVINFGGMAQHVSVPYPIFAYAALLHKELEAKAERRRLLRDRRAAEADAVVVGRVTALRRAVGTALVKTGERVQGAKRATGDAHLRPAG